MAKQAKKTAQTQSAAPVKRDAPPGGFEHSGARAQAVMLNPRRGSGNNVLLDEATERVYRNCLYPDTITFDQYYDMYARNNVAARVIETFPNYTWSVVPSVSDVGGPSSRFSKAANKLLERMYPWQDGLKQSLLTTMKQLDILGGIGGEALLVFGFRDGKSLDQPVQKGSAKDISWIKVLHNGQFHIDSRIDDTDDPNYGDVKHYKSVAFNRFRDLNAFSAIADGKLIHSSRCVHFKESTGISYGMSRIQKCYNQLLDITKLAGASAEVYWLGAFSGLSVESQDGREIGEDTYNHIKQETAKYFDGLARTLVFDGAGAKLLYPAIVSPKDHFDLQIAMVSIGTEIPRRFLTGAEAAKLASQQDTLNWMERVTNRRVSFIGPKVVAPVVERCVFAGVIPFEPREGTFTVVWPKSQSQELVDRSNAGRNMTEALATYYNSGIYKTMPFRDYLVGLCGFDTSEADELAAVTNTENWKAPVKETQSQTKVAKESL
jgi:hypothetical protein